MFEKCIFLLIFVMPLFTISTEEACTVKNISCTELKTRDGYYKFSFNSTMAAGELEITQNGTAIVNGAVNSLNLLPDVVHCDNKSITTRTCNNLNVKFLHEKGDRIWDSCQIFNVVPETLDPGEKTVPEAVYSSTARKPIGVALSVVAIMGCVALGYIVWRKKRVREGKSDEENGINELALDDNRQNIAVEQQQHLLKQTSFLACLHSDDAEANGRNEDTITNTDADRTITNGNIRVVNGALPHQGMNGNMWHDPGDGNADADMHRNGDLEDGWTLGEQSPDGHKDKGQHSPRYQGAAKQGFDETAGGKAEELVNSLGLSSESTTPPGVEKDSLLQNKSSNIYNI